MSARRDWLETLPYFRRKAAKCLRCGWTREQLKNTEYAWTRSLHSPASRSLATLVEAERRIHASSARKPAGIPQITFDIQDYARRIFMPWATEQAA